MDKNVIEIIDTIQELLVNIIRRIDDICNEYAKNNFYDENRVSNIFDDLEALSEGVDVVKQYYGNLDLLEFKDKLSLMANSLESQDYALFMDLMQYELKPLLQYWTDCFKN